VLPGSWYRQSSVEVAPMRGEGVALMQHLERPARVPAPISRSRDDATRHHRRRVAELIRNVRGAPLMLPVSMARDAVE
jgi:hypothetical protein